MMPTLKEGYYPKIDRLINQDYKSVPIIELSNLVKTYKTPAGNVPALRGINLKVAPGEFTCVIGKSGAGKSTMVNMITGIDHPDSGMITIDNIAIHKLNEDKRARWRGKKLGVIFQFFQLLPNLSLIKNITIPMDFCNTYPLSERRERALHLLDQVGIAEHANKAPSEISGGQQQCVAIARALANNPPIIIADEPTGNLDSKTAGEILELFLNLVEQGKTVLIVTHDNEIAEKATRKVEISDGLIIKS